MAKSPKDKDDIRDILETHYEKVNPDRRDADLVFGLRHEA